MRVGGPAERVLVARTGQEIVRLARVLWDEGEDWLLLGGGSNTVVSDAGFPGAVLLLRSEGIERVDESVDGPGDDPDPASRIRLRVQAGHDWDALVAECVERGWSGIESLAGIPGRVGAAPVQNIGAYGAELSDVLHSIEFLDAASGEVVRLPAEALDLGYRHSRLKAGLAGVVLSIDLVLRSDPEHPNPLSAPVRYGQLADALGITIGERVALRELRRTVLRLRASKGMVLDEQDHDTWSAGSFFTNPIVSESFVRTLPSSAPRFPVAGADPAPAVTSFEELAAGVPLRLPDTAPPRRMKLSAAWLIERAGIPKGFRIPGSGAAISSKHTLAITNRGAASADDVAQLARYVVQRVQAEFGVILVPEPNLYGLEL
ncbi:UDP-N-acetylmuramate dehydrogenase [Leucobacter weissii]|uniref:UDP-N-acetylenolpyruvoylglucosamine reductase n=1 Tax=Leucobacter weissii TaxID=1983706 RepID=A0A939MKV7_9MICO|nr:UDP-N-acetylmuramate dehydrogenase [Leucobacter weissii]